MTNILRTTGPRRGPSRRTALILATAMVMTLLPTVVQASEQSMRELVEELVSCRPVEGENYCLYLGFTDMEPGSPRWEQMLVEGDDYGETSPPGALSLKESLLAAYNLPRADRAQREAAEWRAARRGVAKLKVTEHVGSQTPIPTGFFDRYRELGIEEGSARAEELREAAATGDPIDIGRWHQPSPEERAEERTVNERFGTGASTQSTFPTSRYLIFDAYREQVSSIYCGPATLQSIDGGDDGGFNSQSFWSDVLNTDAQNGTAISDLVTAINDYTGWDNKHGAYRVIDTDGWGATYYFSHHKVNIGSYGSVLVDHVQLRNEYFTYLAKDHNGHFQTARGYSESSNTIAIFEPYDERDWTSGGNYTGKHQYVHYQNAYQANQAYPSWNTNVGS